MNPFSGFVIGFLEVVSIIFLVTSIAIAVIIILEKRSPFKTIAWILILVLIPVLGLVVYLFFGQEYRKRKIFSRKGLKELGQIRSRTSKQLRLIHGGHFNLEKNISSYEKIITLLLNNSHSLLTTGNQVKILNNGEETFREIFDAIENAAHHIHLEYYIIENDKIGNRLKNLLIKKLSQGTEVRVIIDDVGSWGLGQKYINDLIENGAQVFSFMEVRFPRLTSKVNYRNHRKILVVDGEIGFTGGINFADRYLEGAKDIGPWRDTHLMITGDAVPCLQVVFAADWFFVSNENLKGKKYFPPFTDAPGIPVQITASGPDSDWENISQAFFAAITGAKKQVYLTSPYFIPPPQIMAAIRSSAMSGVDVRIIIPEKSDAAISKWCSFSFVEELLEAGVRVYFFQGGFIHSKLLLVDSEMASVGTTNLDFRSLETNFEINAFIYDETVTRKLVRFFMADLRKSREIDLEDWQNRRWENKLRESLAHLVSPML